jgi:peptidyl-prolyl cis-trans isomerase B (cyclophilin B)
MITPPSRLLAALLATALLTAASARAQQTASPSPASPAPTATLPVQDIRITLHTDKGDVDGTLFATHAPVTVANFLHLAQQHFYDGLTFHRVISNFMIQGGDPDGNGRGGPGYTIDDEPNGNLRFDKPGVFAMANRGPNTNGSQFFITHQAVPWLNDDAHNGHYTIFGQVTKGQDVVNQITQGDRVRSIDILDATLPLFTAQAKHIEQWDASMAKDKQTPKK